MKEKQEYKIPFTGLKLGHHEFIFEVTETFFESCEYSEIDRANCQVRLNMEKQSTMLVLNFFISGSVVIPCDRCTDDMEIQIEGEYGYIAKFSEEPRLDTEEIVYLPPSEYQIDVKESIYQFIHLSLPSKRVHDEGECNEKMIETLDKYLLVDIEPEALQDLQEDSQESSNVDPRWEALNKLRKEN